MLTPTEVIRLKRASLRHLLDLKRAGMSPRYCELIVDGKSDRIVALPQRRREQPRRRG
jgi:hypothetical protein